MKLKDDKGFYHHLFHSNFTSSDLTENFRRNKMTVKGFFHHFINKTMLTRQNVKEITPRFVHRYFLMFYQE